MTNCKQCAHLEACGRWTDFPKQHGEPTCRHFLDYRNLQCTPSHSAILADLAEEIEEALKQNYKVQKECMDHCNERQENYYDNNIFWLIQGKLNALRGILNFIEEREDR